MLKNRRLVFMCAGVFVLAWINYALHRLNSHLAAFERQAAEAKRLADDAQIERVKKAAWNGTLHKVMVEEFGE